MVYTDLGGKERKKKTVPSLNRVAFHVSKGGITIFVSFITPLLIILLAVQPFVTVVDGFTPDVPLLPGDILLTKSADSPLHGHWKHIALYVGDEYVVESSAAYDTEHHVWLKTGVTYTKVNDLCSRQVDEVLVMRLEDNPQAVTAAVDYAESQVGKNYDWLLRKSNEQSQYCSELIWHAYKVSGIDLDSDGGPFVTPDDIANSLHLTEVHQQKRSSLP